MNYVVTFVATVVEVARQTLRLQWRPRSLLLAFGTIALFAGIVLAFASRAARQTSGVELFGITVYWVLVQVAIPFVVLYLAVKAVHGDLEDRTATFLFLRPLPRPAILLGKWIGVAVHGWLIAAAVVLATYAVLTLPGWNWRHGIAPNGAHCVAYVQALGLAVPAYAAAGALFSVFFKRPLVTGAAFLLVVEILASNLPPQAGVRAFTVADPVRRWIVETIQPRGELREALTGSLAGVDPARLGDPIDALIRFTLVSLVLAAWIHARREYDSRVGE